MQYKYTWGSPPNMPPEPIPLKFFNWSNQADDIVYNLWMNDNVNFSVWLHITRISTTVLSLWTR